MALRARTVDVSAVLSTAGMFLVIMDSAGRLLYVNRAAGGVSTADLLGRHYRSFLRPSHRERFRRVFERVLEREEPQRVEAVAADAGGKPRRYAMLLTPALQPGSKTCVVIVSVDVTAARGRPDEKSEAALRAGELPPRQRAVLRLVAEGFSNKEIARRLSVATRTIETHREQLMDRLSLRGTADITRFAIEAGLV